MLHKAKTVSIILFPLLSLISSNGLSGDESYKEGSDQQKLQSLQKMLDQASQQREQQTTKMQNLSRQLECNWTLIRAYEVCGKLHKNDPNGHLECSTTAKQNAAQCLERAGKE